MKAKGATKDSDAKAKKTGTTATMKAAPRSKAATTRTQRASTTATRKAVATTATRKAATTGTRKAAATATRKAVATTATRRAATSAPKKSPVKASAPREKKAPAAVTPAPFLEAPAVPMVDASLPAFSPPELALRDTAAAPAKPAREKRAPRPKAAKPAPHEEVVPELPNASSGSPIESRISAAVLSAPLMAELPLDAPAAPPGTSAEVTPLAGGPDVLTMASSSGRLKMFVKAVRDAGLATTLDSPGPFTVFAPSDRAFGKLSPRELDQLMADKTRLASAIRHHVVEGLVRLRAGATRGATALDGATLTITSENDSFAVNGARIVQSNIRASNGVIHVIDRVLRPR